MATRTFKLTRVSGAPVSDEKLLADLRAVAARLGRSTVGQKEYRRVGTYDDSTVTRRFGSWNDGLRLAGLDLANELDLSDGASVRPFFAEGVFWLSLIYLFLRAFGFSRTRPYRALVRVEPFWWRDETTKRESRAGLYATAVVMAESDLEARTVACETVMHAVGWLREDVRNASAVPDAEEITAMSGVVWRVPKGYTFFALPSPDREQ